MRPRSIFSILIAVLRIMAMVQLLSLPTDAAFRKNSTCSTATVHAFEKYCASKLKCVQAHGR